MGGAVVDLAKETLLLGFLFWLGLSVISVTLFFFIGPAFYWEGVLATLGLGAIAVFVVAGSLAALLAIVGFTALGAAAFAVAAGLFVALRALGRVGVRGLRQAILFVLRSRRRPRAA